MLAAKDSSKHGGSAGQPLTAAMLIALRAAMLICSRQRTRYVLQLQRWGIVYTFSLSSLNPPFLKVFTSHSPLSLPRLVDLLAGIWPLGVCQSLAVVVLVIDAKLAFMCTVIYNMLHLSTRQLRPHFSSQPIAALRSTVQSHPPLLIRFILSTRALYKFYCIVFRHLQSTFDIITDTAQWNTFYIHLYFTKR